MSQNSEFLASMLKSGARAYAAYASGELLESQPDAKEGFGADPFSAWQSWLSVRVEELAAAAGAEDPGMFTSQVHWAKALLQERGVSAEHFRAGLTSLKGVLAKELPEQVQPLAERYLDEALEAFDEQATDIRASLLPDSPHGRLASAYLLALLEGDRRRASRVVLDAVDRPETVRNIYLHVLLPAQEELGRMWLTGEINVAEEHFASHTTKTVMAQLLSRAEFRPTNGKTVLTAAVAGNRHDIGLYAVADFFEMAGWRTVQLGADVPIGDLVEAVECFEVDLLALAASLNVQLATVRSTIQAVRSGPRGGMVKILVGGLAFADADHLPVEMGADAYAANPDRAVRVGCQLVGLPGDHGAG
ncbi:MAG: cobalamin B12-binding domain-containing protein [Planctomycetota bacterium]|jgi:methanogenic corrinoid protein MtbC1